MPLFFQNVRRRILPPFYEEVRGLQVRRKLMLLIRNPDGDEIDITERFQEGFGGLTSVAEIDILELAHDDIELEVDDRDEAIRDFIRGAKAGEEWVVVLLRETGRRRPKWERMFAGLLDVPWSIIWDDDEHLLTLQVFSFSKRLLISIKAPMFNSATSMFLRP